jgi:hypothetical protein
VFPSIVQGRDKVKVAQMVTGTITGLPAGQKLWALIQPLQDPNLVYHPQGTPKGNSLATGPDGAWRTACRFGEPSTPSGQDYSLLIVSATKSADQEFSKYLTTAQAGGFKGLNPLPGGATVVGTVHVFR